MEIVVVSAVWSWMLGPCGVGLGVGGEYTYIWILDTA